MVGSHSLVASFADRRMYCFRWGRFSTVGLHGSTGVSVGGRARAGHWQGEPPGLTTPEFEHLGRPNVAQCAAVTQSGTSTAEAAAVVGVCSPIWGKLAGMVPRSMQVDSWYRFGYIR